MTQIDPYFLSKPEVEKKKYYRANVFCNFNMVCISSDVSFPMIPNLSHFLQKKKKTIDLNLIRSLSLFYYNLAFEMKFEFGKFEINFKQIILSNHIIFYRVLFNMKNNKNANFL